jgi:hypothetical protein
VDCVNPIPATRNAWLDLANAVGVTVIEVETICSDVTVHRSRLETGTTAADGGQPPMAGRYAQLQSVGPITRRDRYSV